MPGSGCSPLPVTRGYISVWPSFFCSSYSIFVANKLIYAPGLENKNQAREGEMSGRRDRGLVWATRERQGFLNVFLFEGTLVISGTPWSFSLSEPFFLQENHSEPHISQNTSPGLKRRRCHSSGKKRRRIAVYRVAPSAAALCCMCERRSRTAEVFLCR